MLLSLFTPAELDSLSVRFDGAEESPLDYYPLLRAGERFPFNDPTLPPRLTPRPADDATFLHGLLESIARIERRAYEMMVEGSASWPDRIVTAGGGAANTAWATIRARVLGLPVVAAEMTEAAVGAARLVATCWQQQLNGMVR